MPITPAMTGSAPQKRLYIKTYGCQMNVYDSERMADVLAPLGYGLVDDPALAKDVRSALLRDPYVSRFDLNVSASNARINLEGRVIDPPPTRGNLSIAGCIRIVGRAEAIDLIQSDLNRRHIALHQDCAVLPFGKGQDSHL